MCADDPAKSLPMDKPKIELPAWLPWATTACLAALVACLGELWLIEKARTRFLREQIQLTNVAAKSAQNELDAERILEQRAVENLRPGAADRAPLVIAMAPPGAAVADSPASGAVVLYPSDGSGLAAVSGGPGQPPERDYQLWLERAGALPALACAVFHGPAAPFRFALPLEPGWRFVVVDGARGGTRTLDEAKAQGSIILATPPFTLRIPSR
jgi:hypothetical protein